MPGAFLCAVEGCGKTFRWNSQLKQHALKHTGEKPFACEWDNCAYRASLKAGLDIHMRKHTGEKPFRCEWDNCSYCAAQRGSLDTHMRLHTGEKPFRCDWEGCSYRAAQQGSLAAHMRVHTGEKPYQCEWENCSFRSTLKGNLNTHMRIHTGERPFRCLEYGCDYSSAQAGTLKSHCKSHHARLNDLVTPATKKIKTTDTARRTSPSSSGPVPSAVPNEKPFFCEWENCSYRSALKGNLDVHVIVHTGERPYRCLEIGCGYSSAQAGTLKTHYRNHHPHLGLLENAAAGETETPEKRGAPRKVSGERPFRCTWENCSYRCILKRNLESHIRVHTGERPFRCPERGRGYASAQYGNLKGHCLNRHPHLSPVKYPTSRKTNRRHAARKRSPCPTVPDSPEISRSSSVAVSDVGDESSYTNPRWYEDSTLPKSETDDSDTAMAESKNPWEAGINGICVSYTPGGRPKVEKIFGSRASGKGDGWSSTDNLDESLLRARLLDFLADGMAVPH